MRRQDRANSKRVSIEAAPQASALPPSVSLFSASRLDCWDQKLLPRAWFSVASLSKALKFSRLFQGQEGTTRWYCRQGEQGCRPIQRLRDQPTRQSRWGSSSMLVELPASAACLLSR